jgi:hypothetical protein
MGFISTGFAPGTSAAVGWLGHRAHGEDGHPGLAWAGATFIRRAEAPGEEGKKQEKAMVLSTFHHLALLET